MANLSFSGEAVSFSPDGKHLGAALWDGRGIALWTLPEKPGWNKANFRFAVVPGISETLALGFSPDSRLLAAGGEEGQVALFGLPDLALLQRFSAHGGAVRSLYFVLDGYGLGLVTAGADGAVHRFNVIWMHRFVAFFMRPPNDLGPDDMARFQHSLAASGVSSSGFNQCVAAPRFFYVRVLGVSGEIQRIRHQKRRWRIPRSGRPGRSSCSVSRALM